MSDQAVATAPFGQFELRRTLWLRERKVCCYCGRPTRLHTKDGASDRATIDHLIPTCRGGADDDSNRASCCRRCNEAKGMLTEEEFRTMSVLEALKFNDAVGIFGSWLADGGIGGDVAPAPGAA